MKQQIFKNIFSNYMGNFISTTLGFLIVPFLIKNLGKEAFGISVLAESIIVFFQVFAFSIRIALSRHATIALSQGKNEEFIEYLSIGRRLLYIAAFLILIPGLFLSFYFPLIFNVPALFHEQSRILFLLIALAFTISMPNMVYWSVLYANQRFDLINYSNFGGLILRAAAIFILFSVIPPSDNGLVIYGFIYLAMTWGQNYIVYRWHKFVMPGLKIGSLKNISNKLKELMAFGGYSSISGVASMMYETIMNIVINIFMGPTFNAVYAISIKIPSVFKKLFLEPAISLAPSFAALVAINDKARLTALFLFYSKAINLVVLPLGFILMALSTPIILRWVGAEFLQSAQIMPIFLGAALFSMPLCVCNGINNAFGKIKVPALVNLVASLLNILLGLFLAFNLQLGIKGIALSVLCMNGLTFMLFMPVYSCKSAGIPVSVYWLQTLIKPLVLTALLFGTAAIPFLLYQDLRTPFHMVALAAISIPLYVGAAYQFVLAADEKRAVRDLLNPSFRKFGLI
jgi:O-antigen/teichoic acid export membrane protein